MTDPHTPPVQPGGPSAGRTEPSSPTGRRPGSTSILDEIDQVVEPVTESVSMAPAVGIAVAGGPMITAARGGGGAQPAPPATADSIRSGLSEAGPVAVAGLVVNGAAALVVVAVARLVTPQAYGAIAQLLGLFFILSMPGSAVLVGVVRRVTAMRNAGHGHQVHRWVSRVHRILLVAIAVELVVVLLIQGWIAHQLSLPNSDGIVLILVAAASGSSCASTGACCRPIAEYRPLAGNLLVEGFVRTFLVVVLVVLHLGVAGYAIGIFVSEVAATVHAHWLASRVWVDPPQGVALGARSRGRRSPRATPPGSAPRPDTALVRRKLMADVSAAFVGLALLGLLQNVDVILLGRLDHSQRRPLRGHLGGVQGAGLRRPGPRGLPAAGGHHPVERRAATPSGSWGSPSSSWPCRPPS